MSLAFGGRLGPYDILAPLGSGGMGEVYRARDTRLGREVAIKVLPAERLADEVRRARFVQEARAASALNHPNIVTIYEIESANGLDFIVMELVPGKTLDAVIPRHGMRLGEALRVAIPLVDALTAAHTAGIVHRDLKPANVMVTPEGVVKVLDFGLAKLRQRDETNLDEAPTLEVHAPLSRPGTVIGTPAYMSPEQASGGQVDARSDVFSIGSVLYEMVTGRRPFGGNSSAEALAALLKDQPKLPSELVADLPKELERIILRCLRKEPERRFQHMVDVKVELQEVKEELDTQATTPGTVARQRSRPRRLAWIGVLLVAAGTTGVVLWGSLRSSPRPVGTMRTLDVSLPDDQRLASPPILSPDGLSLAYAAVSGGSLDARRSEEEDARTRLFLRSIVTGVTQTLPGTEGALSPFFSPDGEWLGFFASGELKKISLRGGGPVSLCDARLASSATWGPDNRIYFLPYTDKMLAWVSASGGTPELLPVPKGAPLGLDSPSVLPGRAALLLRVFSGELESPIGVLSLETGRLVTLRERGVNPRYVSTGRILYIRSGSLVSVPFDLKTLQVTGPETPIVGGVTQYSVADDGTLVYTTGDPSAERELVWVDRAGLQTSSGLPAGRYGTFKLSPDGGRLAIEIEGAKTDVWVLDLDQGTRLRLTHVGRNGAPTWTPDGGRVVFTSNRDGTYGLYWMRADGAGQDEPLLTGGHVPAWGSWSPDGSSYVFTEMRAGQPDLWILSRTGDRNPFPFLDSPSSEWGPGFSPDGKWIAYCSDESGRFEIYVRPSPGRRGDRQAVSLHGGEEPLWSRRGDELFYRSGPQWMVVPVRSGEPLRLGAARPLFSGDYFHVAGVSYDVSPDGRRFLVLKTSRLAQGPNRLVVVLNWPRRFDLQAR